MSWWTSAWTYVVIVFSFLWTELLLWLSVFIAPMKNWEMLWILVPIWINWFFTEFFQEKKGTSLGNAVTNGGVMAWVGVDWIRYMVRMLNEGSLQSGPITIVKFALSGFVVFLGIFIIIEGVRTKQFVHILGRVRETSYVLIMVSPVIYGVVEPSWQYLVALLLYAPLFYYVIELIDKYTPNPKTYEDKDSSSKTDSESSSDPFSSSSSTSSDPFGSPSQGSNSSPDPFSAGNQSSDPFNQNPPSNSIDDTFRPR